MATIESYMAFDQDGLENFYPLKIDKDFRNYSLSRNIFTITEKKVGNPLRFDWGGKNLQITITKTNLVVNGGTFTSLDIHTINSPIQKIFSATGLNINAKSFQDASLSSSNSDDRRIIETMLRGSDNFTLSDQSDTVRSYAGDDIIFSRGGNDYLDAGAGNDRLDGGNGNDNLIGGLGKDTLTGASGTDRFTYRSIEDSGVGSSNRDVITDFQGNSREKIDLSAIDAYTGKTGNQAFTYIGSSGFTGTKGEVRFSGGVLQMNTGTDKVADMEIALTGVTAFQSSFLIL
jgi:Ca2+-binding RTX toxin-like protein